MSVQTFFSVIGIAETNVNRCHQDLYRLNNYIAEYNDKFPGKHEGSGCYRIICA